MRVVRKPEVMEAWQWKGGDPPFEDGPKWFESAQFKRHGRWLYIYLPWVSPFHLLEGDWLVFEPSTCINVPPATRYTDNQMHHLFEIPVGP